MKKNNSFPYISVLLCVFFFTGCTTTIRLNPHFEERRQQIHTIGVMPCESNIVLIKFKGDNERMRDEETLICGLLTAAVRGWLKTQGFTLSEQQICLDTNEIFSLSEEQRFSLTSLKKQVDYAFGKMYKQPAYTPLCSLSLGAESEINMFADMLKSDALVFVKMLGYKKSEGQQWADLAKTVLLGSSGSSPEAGFLFIMVVDGNSGDMLWANASSTTITLTDKTILSMVEAVFKGFPKLKKKRPAN